MAIKTSTTKRRMAAPAAPLLSRGRGTLWFWRRRIRCLRAQARGFSRRRSDGTYISSEYIDPYGYVIPRGKCLVITDLSYYSGFSQPLAPGALTKLTLGIVKVSSSGWQQTIMFVASPTVFKQQGDWRQRQLEHGVRRQSRLLSIRHPACARGPREHRPVCIRLSEATVGAFASMRSSTFGKHRFWLAQI